MAYGMFAAAEDVFVLAPPLLLPLGLILLRTQQQWRRRAAINALVASQGLWLIAAAVALPLRRLKGQAV